MKPVLHRLAGYDRQTELEKFAVTIPNRFVGKVSDLVPFDGDDPDAVGCYALTADQAHRIAILVHKHLPSGLDFFFEGFSS